MIMVLNKKLYMAVTILLVATMIAVFPPFKGMTPQMMAMIGISILALAYWSTECLPIPITGVVIILLIAVFGVMPLSEALAYIASDVNMLILAGLVIAVALSKYEVDKYLSLKLLYIIGGRADRVVFGMMLSVALISMWIPNTAAAAIMIPVAVGMLNLMGAKKGESNLGKVMMIGVAYAASIGGIGTPVGTPPVPITIKNVKEALGIEIGFATWMYWGVPLSILLVLVAWFVLMNMYKLEVREVPGGRQLIEKELNKIGGLKGMKLKTLTLFLAAVVLWLLDPIASSRVQNWTYIVSLIIIIMFVMPGVGVLDWRDVSREADWGTLFLVAGGLALGGGLRKTGLIDLMAKGIASRIGNLHPFAMVAIIGVVSSLAITVFCSITATSSTMVPVSIAMAKALNIHPLVAAVASGVASCFAFMLPANTPPNAIAYSHGYFKSKDMARVGIVLILLSVLISLPFTLLLVPYIMKVPITLQLG